MKIIQKTQNLIVLKDGRIISFIIGIIFILFGLFLIISPMSFNGVPSFWVGIGVIVCGLMAILFPKSSTVLLNKDENKVYVVRKSIIGGRSQEEYAFDQIAKVELQYKISREIRQGSGLREQYSYRLIFVLTDGRNIPLTMNFSGASTVRFSGINITGGIVKVKERTLGEKLAIFIGVPFVDIMPSFGGALINF